MSLVMKMGSAWTGDASEAAQAGAAPLLQAFRDGQRALSTHQELMGAQTHSFGVAKTSVHDVPNEPPSASFGDMLSDASGVSLFTGGGYLNKVQDWSEKANANVTAYTGYANASSYNQSNMPQEYGDPSGSGSDIALAPAQPGPGDPGPGGPGGITGPGSTGGPHHPVSHYGGGPDTSAYTPSGSGTPGPGTGGLPGPGTPGYGTGPTNTQGWQGGPSAPGAGGWPTPPGGGGQSWGFGGDGFPGAVGAPFGGGGGFDGGTAGGGTASGGARGLRAGGMAGTAGVNAAERQAGPGARAGAGASGASSPGAALATGRAGAPGAPGAGGMAGAAGRGGRKEEDQEHTSAAYLEDDYSDELIGELPRTTPPVIGLD
ncbi:hypothetical protein ACFFS4_36770 [Kutzneria kofuensis]|nr:hypothetical protein [Kutzneria kofuensis]